jgi:hypothetical protein
MLCEELPRALRKLGRCGLVYADLVQRRRVNLGELGSAVSHPRQPLQLPNRILIGNIFVEQARYGRQGGGVVLFLLLVQLRQPGQQLPTLVRILAVIQA